MNYFSKKGQEYKAQNSLQSYILDQVRQYDQLMVESTEKFLQVIESTVTNANRRYPRCTPVNVYGWTSPAQRFAHGKVEENPDFIVDIGGLLVRFTLHAVKGELLGQPGALVDMLSSGKSTNVAIQTELPLFAQKEVSHV